MTDESAKQLLCRNHNYIHLRLIVFGLKGLTRKQIGGKVLLALYDSRFSVKKKSILGLVKVDIN